MGKKVFGKRRRLTSPQGFFLFSYRWTSFSFLGFCFEHSSKVTAHGGTPSLFGLDGSHMVMSIELNDALAGRLLMPSRKRWIYSRRCPRHAQRRRR
ncbi:hypothetical protein V6Z12_D06G027800 [Gossypium hirsutum]